LPGQRQLAQRPREARRQPRPRQSRVVRERVDAEPGEVVLAEQRRVRQEARRHLAVQRPARVVVDERDLHATAAGTRARRSRTISTAQITTKMTVAISIAAAAPVAPQSQPKATTSGTTTIVSTVCVQSRRS